MKIDREGSGDRRTVRGFRGLRHKGGHILLGQANAVHKVLKARVGAERIEARSQQDSWVKSLFVAFFEPIHGLIRISERCIGHGNLPSVRIARVGALLRSLSRLTASLLLPDATKARARLAMHVGLPPE